MLSLTRQMTAVIFDSRLISSPDLNLTTALAVKGEQCFSVHVPAIKPIKHLFAKKNITYFLLLRFSDMTSRYRTVCLKDLY